MDENFDTNGTFLYGKFAYEDAKFSALNCKFFMLDSDEDELVCDYDISCYNCLFRRWSEQSFECLKYENL